MKTRQRTYPHPEFLVKGAGDEASFKEHPDPGLVPLLHLKVQVGAPGSQLTLFQWLYMEIRPLDGILAAPAQLHLCHGGLVQLLSCCDYALLQQLGLLILLQGSVEG